MSEWYDRDGQPITMDEWGRLLEDTEYKRVDWTDLPGGGSVSTVWLGLDHGFGAGERLIFETMDLPHFAHQWRYSTLEEARAGHAAAVAALSAEGK